MRSLLSAVGLVIMVQIRILSAQPTKDGEQWKITAARHNDDWYVDSYQQNPTPFYRNPFASPPNRPPFPWRPNASFRPNDPLLPGVPAIAAYANPAGGVIMLGALPVNQFSALTNAPQVPLQASVTSGSGTQTFYIALSAIDANGKESQASNLIMATGAVIGSTITISGVVWDSGATGYTVYYGPDQLHMWQVANVAGSTPGTVSATITAIDGIGMPDAVFSKFRIVVTPIRHGGIWGSAPTVVGSFSMTFPGASAATNDYAGRIISFYGSNNPTLAITAGQFSGYVPQTLWSFAVTSNTSAGVMTLATNPALYFAGDAFVVRAQANIASANSIGDAFFVNPYAPSGLTVNAEAGKVVWIMAGTGKGFHKFFYNP